MSDARARLRKLRVAGGGQPNADLEFGPGLTLITGLSNTGKTHIVECINYALGSGTLPREIPEARGYKQVQLELEKDGKTHTVIRSYATSEQALIADCAIDDWDGAEGEEVKVKINPNAPLTTLSGWLVEAGGFDPATPIVKNERGQQQALSFRGISPFVLIDESAVIRDGSPILPSNTTQQTAARSMFRVLLTGEPPTDEIVTLRDAHRVRDEAGQRVNLLAALVEELREEIADDQLDRVALEKELAAIDAELTAVSEMVASSGDAVRALIAARNEALANQDAARKAASDARETRKRFLLLREHYSADIDRLQFVLEGGHFFQQIAASHCPRCGRPLDPEGKCHPEEADFADVERACRVEIDKLAPRLRDLERALADADAELERASLAAQASGAAADRANDEIARMAEPTAAKARARVEAITVRRREVEAALARFRELDRFIRLREESQAAADKRLLKYRPEQDVAALSEFGDHVETLLRDWRFPIGSGVHFSIDTEDLVIDGKNRSDNGKGVRAVTHAAFTIGLMHHCLDADTPHPGFVVIDTPLTHFKGIEDDVDDPALTSNVHTAFLHSLAAQPAGQTIIVENVEPPAGLDATATVYNFVANAPDGRTGFYPIS